MEKPSSVSLAGPATDLLSGDRATAVREHPFKQPQKFLERLRSAVGIRFHVDRNTIGKALRHLEKTTALARSQAIIRDMGNTPPCLLQLLFSIYRQVHYIVRKTGALGDDDLRRLDACVPFRMTIENILRRCKQLSQLLGDGKPASTPPATKGGGTGCCDVGEAKMSDIMMMTILFNYVDQELKALFPKGEFIGYALDRVVRKQAAQDFWKKNFDKQTMVSWRDFIGALSKEHRVQGEREAALLRNAIDLTWNDHVSLFELDVFSRLFQPWESLLKNWRFLTHVHPAFFPYLTYEQVRTKLEEYMDKPGSYLFRFSTTSMGCWSIAFVTSEKTIKQTVLRNEALIPALKEGERQGTYLFPAGNNENPVLSHDILDQATIQLKEDREVFLNYSYNQSSYQECKICFAMAKDRRLEPCGHMLCAECLRKQGWDSGMSASSISSQCPFCRQKIDGFEIVAITPFRPDPRDKDLRSRLDSLGIAGMDSEDEEEHQSLLSPESWSARSAGSAVATSTATHQSSSQSPSPSQAFAQIPVLFDPCGDEVTRQPGRKKSSVGSVENWSRQVQGPGSQKGGRNAAILKRNSISSVCPSWSFISSEASRVRLVTRVSSADSTTLCQQVAVNRKTPAWPMPSGHFPVSQISDRMRRGLVTGANDSQATLHVMTTVGVEDKMPVGHPPSMVTAGEINYLNSNLDFGCPGPTRNMPLPASIAPINYSEVATHHTRKRAVELGPYSDQLPIADTQRAFIRGTTSRAWHFTVRQELLSLGHAEEDIEFAMKTAGCDIQRAKAVLDRLYKDVDRAAGKPRKTNEGNCKPKEKRPVDPCTLEEKEAACK